MKKIIFSFALASAGFLNTDAATVVLSGALSSRQLTAEDCYILRGCVTVGNGVTLDIDPGVEVRAEQGASLVIMQGGVINAIGTASLPIVFTSDQSIGNRTEGRWAGLSISGQSANNQTSNSFIFKRCNSNFSAGGNTVSSNSGTLKFVRIEFAGATTSPDITEPAGLLLAGVGSGTTIEDVQVTQSGSNGIKIMGGDVDLKSIFVLNAFQNDLYINYGYTGDISYILGIRNNPNAHSSLGSNGILIENDNSGSSNTPLTYPKITYSTLIGPDYCEEPNYTPHANFQDGIRFNNNGGADISDCVISGFADFGLYIVDNASAARTAASPQTLSVDYTSFQNNGLADYGTLVSPWSGVGCDLTMQDWIEALGSSACQSVQNQFSPFNVGYDNSMCDNYCEAVPDFILTDATELAAGSSTEFERGAIQFDVDLFAWAEVCPQSKEYCQTTLLKAALQESSNLQVYPNPATEMAIIGFEVKKTGKATIFIYEAITGRVIMKKVVDIEQSGHQAIDIRLPNLKEGMYPVRIQTAEEVIYGKLSVK